MNPVPDFVTNRPDHSRRPRRRPRHSHGRPEHSFWQFGAGILPPAALIGLTIAVIGWIRPDFGAIREIKFVIYLLIAVCLAGLGTIFYGLRAGSKRLERKEVWIAMVLGFLTLLALLSVVFQSRLMPKAKLVPQNISNPL